MPHGDGGRIAGVNTATLHMQSVIGPKKRKYRKNTKNIVQPARILLPFPHIQYDFLAFFLGFFFILRLPSWGV